MRMREGGVDEPILVSSTIFPQVQTTEGEPQVQTTEGEHQGGASLCSCAFWALSARYRVKREAGDGVDARAILVTALQRAVCARDGFCANLQ